ncbi:MAG: Mur ligase family protein [Cytophagaceae bacterium]|nr:Mur ligase family protein [Cytophagaceae bacterium]MDW8456253.1 Mur ligase family protein [Cytophagaceae bacterium]
MNTSKRVHFIAIGGSVMHNLAISLSQSGYEVTGSDDEIFEPSLSKLKAHGLLPEQLGWFPEKITSDVDQVIVGMHAKADNPELMKAIELGIKIYSFPEYIYEFSKDKQRVVIAGSHGKTTITAMVMHVLKYYNRKFDYLVGAQIEGFDTMVKLSDDAPLIIIEGDEYPTSPLDKTPKFLHYKHHIGVISGIAWDHVNVYPSFDEYVRQFELFADATPKGGIIIFNENDDLASFICKEMKNDVQRIEYQPHKNEIINGVTYLLTDYGKIPIKYFGKHNMRNTSAALKVCTKIGITEAMFYKAIQSFKGAANRLEVINKNYSTIVFKDFAHAPSKVKATTNAVKKQYERKELVAVLELHTYSSLTRDFLSQYRDSMKAVDIAIVYYNPENFNHKNLTPFSPAEVLNAFNHPTLKVFTDSSELENFLLNIEWSNKNLLIMTSGNFGGIDVRKLASQIVEG